MKKISSEINGDPTNCNVSIVIPVYQSSIILPKLVEAIYFEMQEIGMADFFELILVNDASTDDSWKVIQKLASDNLFVKGISLRKNFGQHNAIMAGLNYVRGRYVILMDDDLQHHPNAIGEMITVLKSGYDVCFTNYINRQHAVWKKWGSHFHNWVASFLLKKPKEIYLSSFKALRREIVKEVIRYDGPYAYIDGLILQATLSITSIDIKHLPRHQGRSNYDIFKLLALWGRMATSFSVLPLRIATYVGLGIAIVSLIMITFIIILKFMHPEISAGWTSLIATVLFIGGVQTLCIGIIGEYIGRTYLRINYKPQFVIGQMTWKSDKKFKE